MRSAPSKKRETGFFREVWVEHNRLIDFVRSTSVQQNGNLGVKVTQTSNGTHLKVDVPKGAPGGGEVSQFRLKSVANDYIICRKLEGSSETGEDVYIAKPHGLRYTGWHGVSHTFTLPAYPGSPGTITVSYQFQTPIYRIKSQGVVTEHQVILPFYLNDISVIYAARVDSGTGVSSADEWIDLNADGRAWGRVV